MRTASLALARLMATLALLAAAGCAGSGGSAPVSTTETYVVGGTVEGLAGATLALSDPAAGSVTLSGDGPFAFPTPLASGSTYAVVVTAQPADPRQHCTVSRASGTVAAADVSDLSVRCARAGRFVYVTESLSPGPVGAGLPPGGILAYAIDPSTGTFQEIPGSPFATDRCPCTLAVTPDGSWAFAGAGGSLYPYRIDPVSGALSAAGAGTAIGMDAGPVAADPGSRFVYVVHPAAGTLDAYDIDPANGTLALVAGRPYPLGTEPSAPGFDPAGHFLYVANGGSSTISAYAIDASDGALSVIPGSPFAAGGTVDAVDVEAAGRFLYATRGSVPPVARFALDAATGALSQGSAASPSPDPAPVAGDPLAFLLGPNSERAYLVGQCLNATADCAPVGGAEPFDFHLWTFAGDEHTGDFSQSGPSRHLLAMNEFSTLVSMQSDPAGKFLCARISSLSVGLFTEFSCYLLDAATGAPLAAYGSIGSAPDTGLARVEVWETITISR